MAEFDAAGARKALLLNETFHKENLRRYYERPFESAWCYFTSTRPHLEPGRARSWKHSISRDNPAIVSRAIPRATQRRSAHTSDERLAGLPPASPERLGHYTFSSQWSRQPLPCRARMARRPRPIGPRQQPQHRRPPVAPCARHRLRAGVAGGERGRHPPGLAARTAAGQRDPATRVRRAWRPCCRLARSRHFGARTSPTAASSQHSRPSPRRQNAAAVP